MKPRIYWASLVGNDIGEVFSCERSAIARSIIYGPVVLAEDGEKPEKGERWAVADKKRRLLCNPETGYYLVFHSRGSAVKWSRCFPGSSVLALKRPKAFGLTFSRRGKYGNAE